MDLNEIKNRLNNLQAKSAPRGEQKNLFWKPSVGKQTVRVVPSKFNKSNPFTEMFFYYGIGNRVMVSPLNFGEKDPIAEFAKQLRQTSDKDNWRLAKKLDAKMRVFAPVIVRGEESEGVKLWQFGKEIYEAFLQLAADEEVGDFTDVATGRDIKLNTVGPESTGTPYNRTTIGPSMKTSALSEDATEIESWLETQVDPKTVFKKYSFDEMKEALQEWLAPEDEAQEGDIIDDEKEEEVVAATPQKNYALKTPAPKVSNADKFDSLFEEEEDDLPF
jgi:hypothetical protein